MRISLLFFLVVSIILGSCKPKEVKIQKRESSLFLHKYIAEDEKSEKHLKMLPFIESLIEDDSTYSFLRSLQPTAAELATLFLDGSALNTAIEYSELQWNKLDKMRRDLFPMIEETETLYIHSATKEDLVKQQLNEMHEKHYFLADVLKPGVRVYEFKFLKEDGSLKRRRTCFFHIEGDRWVFFPYAFQAFGS